MERILMAWRSNLYEITGESMASNVQFEIVVVARAIVRDDIGMTSVYFLFGKRSYLLVVMIDEIQRVINEWSDRGAVDLILTSGGTGFGHRDRTPEAIKPLLHR
jgi:molybdopterin biosynthesis enzyme MoaB